MASEPRRRSSAVSLGNWMWTLLLNGTPVFILLQFLGLILGYVVFLMPGSLTEPVLSSVQRWLGFGCFAVVPLVGLVFWVLTWIISAKASKRRWALANIIWFFALLLVLLIVYVFTKEKILEFLNTLLNTPIFGGAQ